MLSVSVISTKPLKISQLDKDSVHESNMCVCVCDPLFIQKSLASGLMMAITFQVCAHLIITCDSFPSMTLKICWIIINFHLLV